MGISIITLVDPCGNQIQRVTHESMDSYDLIISIALLDIVEKAFEHHLWKKMNDSAMKMIDKAMDICTCTNQSIRLTHNE